MRTFNCSAIILISSFLILSCTGEKQEKNTAETASDVLKNITEEAGKLAKEGAKDVVDEKLLENLLPTDADGLARKKVSSEKTGAMGFQVASAEAKYGEGDSSIGISLVDVAATGAIMGMAAWALVDVNKKTESTYEKTTTYKDHKAFEKYDSDRKDGEVAGL